MIQVIATNLIQDKTKEKCEEESLKLGFTEYLPFSRGQNLIQLSGELPVVQMTFTIEEDESAENETERAYVIDNSYMLLASNVKDVMSVFLTHHTPHNYDVKDTMMPISYNGFNQETDAKILSIRFYPRKFRQDQLLCRCFMVVPTPFTAEDLTVIEDLLRKKINNENIEPIIEDNNSNISPEVAVINPSPSNINSKLEEKLPEELMSAKINDETSNSYEESVYISPSDIAQTLNNSDNFQSKGSLPASNINDDEDFNIDDLISSTPQNTSAANEAPSSAAPNNVVLKQLSTEDIVNRMLGKTEKIKHEKSIDDFNAYTKSKQSNANDNEQSKSKVDKPKRINDKISQYLEFMSFVDDEEDEEKENNAFLQDFSNNSIKSSRDKNLLEDDDDYEDEIIIDEVLKDNVENDNQSKQAAAGPINKNSQSSFNNLMTEKSNIVIESNKIVSEKIIKQNVDNINNKVEVANNIALDNVAEAASIKEVEQKDVQKDMIQNNVEESFTPIASPVATENNHKQDISASSYISPELKQFIGGRDHDTLLQDLMNKMEENKELFIDISDNLAEYKTVSKKDVLNKAFSKVVKYFKQNERSQVALAQRDEALKKDVLHDIERHIDDYIKEIPNDDKTLLNSMIKRALFSYYILTPLINDDTVSDIKVLSYDKINIKKRGIHYTVNNLSFLDEDDYKTFIDNLIERYQVPINNMFLVFSDVDFNKDYRLRFNISLPYVNSTGLPYLHIRKVPKNKLSLTNLIDAKMLTPEVALYLIDAIKNKSILISGPSASGKTNLANALIDVIPYEYSGLVIQESEELFSDKHPNLMFQHIIKNCDLEALGTNGLLCDAGYFIIGEIKGKEARNFSKAAATGHKCMATIHASSSAKSIDRLVDYIRLGDKNYTTEDSLRLIQDMNVLVFVKDFKIQEIDEVVGIHENGQELLYKPIYRFQ